MPDTLKVVLVLIAIIALIRFKVALSLSLFGASILLGVLFHLTPAQLARAFYRGALDPETLKLAAALLLILLFSAVLKEIGNMSRAITALRAVFRDSRVTVGLIPAIVGLVPVIGGAMLSAPLVSEAADDLQLSAEQRTFLNFWFRHIWEYSLPTFPGIFLASAIVGIPLVDICLANLPLTLASITAGIFFGFRGVKPPPQAKDSLPSTQVIRRIFSFLLNLLPFFLVIFLTLYCHIHLAYVISIVTIGLIFLYGIPLSLLRKLARASLSLELALLIFGIMIFKETLLESGAMNGLAGEMSRMGMPPVFLIILLPGLIAFITGYSPAFVGLSFPVLTPLFPSGRLGTFYIMLAIGSGLSAHLLSPMHSCLVMTLDYYKASVPKTYRMLFAPVAVIFFTGVIILLLAWIFLKGL